jgi:predicted methyltransferase
MELHQISDQPRRQAGQALRTERQARGYRGRYQSAALALGLAVSLLAGLTACGDKPSAQVVVEKIAKPVQLSKALSAATKGMHRSASNAARDPFRHPAETLSFFGVAPSDTVVELWPGGGWYTEVLASYLRDSGRFIAASFDPNSGVTYHATVDAKYKQKLADAPMVYDQVEVVPFGKPYQTLPLDDATVDVILTFRSSHNWMRDDAMEDVYRAAFRTLKSGGTFGVVQHRGKADQPPLWARKFGYMPEAYVVSIAEKVGFRLAGRSEVNANPADRKDYPDGVWTLPPSYRLGDQDREEYAAIGESDRMTLKFVKP